MESKAIRFSNVSKQFGDGFAVKDISFVVNPGTLTTLLGPSGCGKTTTLRMIAGLESPTSGQIFIGDQDVSQLPTNERDVSMVFQSYALFPHMTVSENVGYGLKVTGTSRPEIKRRTEEALKTVGLSGLEARFPSQLSGGQQQRVAVARALILEPSVLLFDEPLSNLDAKLRRQMREEIRELQQRLSLTVVYVTHDQAEAMAVSDQIIVMDRSIIVQQGTPAELYLHPKNRFVAGFMGDANHVKGKIIYEDDEYFLSFGGCHVPYSPKKISEAGAEVGVAIRPEAIEISRSSERFNSSSFLQGTIRKVTYIGVSVEYTIATDLGQLFAVDAKTDVIHRVGSPVALSFAPNGVIPLMF